ncbi:MAG: hypothetical protein GC162_19910 [Planctomycetes bacterium]|nr:hypothetical protein [Planctomycetota bacterium]
MVCSRSLRRPDPSATFSGSPGSSDVVTDFPYFSTGDQNQVAEERDKEGNPARQYVWGDSGGYIDELIQQRDYPDAEDLDIYDDYYQLADLHYRSVALTCSAGCLVEAYDTDAYGQTQLFYDLAGNCRKYLPLCPYIYTGRRYDPETALRGEDPRPALYYYRARYYHPTLGTFISRDPRGYTSGMGLYGYTGGNPLIYTDPRGKERDPWIAHLQHEANSSGPGAAAAYDALKLEATDIGSVWNTDISHYSTLYAKGGLPHLVPGEPAFITDPKTGYLLPNPEYRGAHAYAGEIPRLTAIFGMMPQVLWSSSMHESRIATDFNQPLFAGLYDNRTNHIAKALALQIEGMTNALGLVSLLSLAAEGIAVGWEALRIPAVGGQELGLGLPFVVTKHELIVQEMFLPCDAPVGLRTAIQRGAVVWRAGSYGFTVEGAAGQHWGLRCPIEPGFLKGYGAATDRIDWILAGRVRPNAPFVIRRAPPIGGNTGGEFEVVTEEYGVEPFYRLRVPRPGE